MAKLQDVKNLIKLSQMFLSSQKHPFVACNNELYKFNDKYYELLEDNVLGKMITKFFIDNESSSSWRPVLCQNIIQTIKYLPSIKNIKEFNNYDSLINISNGIYDFDKKKLSSHTPDKYFTSIVKVDYDSNNTDASGFIGILNDIFKNPDGSVDKKALYNILQIGGYLMYPKNKVKSLFLFFGTGSNGKGIVMEHAYKMFFDKHFISALSLNTLSKDESSSRKLLLTSRVNFATEQKAGDIESEELKKIVSGEDISIERKYQDAMTFKPNTKIIVSANRLPRFKDTTYGTDRRLMMINFQNQFVSQKEYDRLRPVERERVFVAKDEDKLVGIMKKEKTAIFNLFIKALEDLRENNWRFNLSRSSESIFSEYKEDSDVVGTWLKDNYELSDSGALEVSFIFSDFNAWWRDNYGDKKGWVNTNLLGRSIKNIFRIKAGKEQVKREDGKWTTASYYKIKRIDEKYNKLAGYDK